MSAGTIENTIAILTEQLQSRWTRQKAPRGFLQAFEKAKAPTTDSARANTIQIFLDVGVQAWVAYFLAQYGPGVRFKGQAARNSTLSAFDLVSAEERRRVATFIQGIPADDSIVILIHRLLNHPPASNHPPAKRRRELSCYLKS